MINPFTNRLNVGVPSGRDFKPALQSEKNAGRPVDAESLESCSQPQDRSQPSHSKEQGGVKIPQWAHRPIVAATAGVAVGVGATALAASAWGLGIAAAAPAILAAAAVGVTVGLVGLKTPPGYGESFAELVSGSVSGMMGAAGGLVGTTATLAMAGGAGAAALATVGAVAVGGAGLLWGIDKLSDHLSGS